IAGLIKKRLPNFALTGIMDVERGAMAGVMTRQLFIRRARRIALNIQRILLGEKAEDLSISIARDERLVINMATARSIGVYPNWSILTEAELISTDREVVQRELTLFKAVREAITVNPELAASSHALTAGSQDIITARANLLPQLEISALGTFIDDDRAESSFGAQAEQSVSATGSLTQIIFSEPVWANLAIQGKFQKAREYQHKQLRLDIILNTATAYLDVLRTKTFEFIQRENLNLTRSNLELARIRQNIGISNPAEVYRWENRIASNRKAVIDANTRRNLAEIALNTILSRPIEEHFTTADIHYDDPNLYIGDYKNMGALDNPWSFRNFRDFMVEKALADSPELAALDASIEANNRRHSSSKMTYWLPSIALKAELTNNFYKGGAGSDFELDPSLPFPISQADDTDWSIGIKASLPIFSGGSRYAATRKISTELKELEKTRRFVTDIIEQRIRSALHLMGASYAGIKQSRDAAEAARKSLEMIVDAYTRGEASILDLIDAQNAALVSDQLAANTIYDFIIDYLNVERAVGSFDFLMPDDMREEHLQKMKEYFKQANMKLGNP
ncbi:MAG: TolC family protein, partial [candidate division Zixibacteria bacterium]|nr:TolC family protein [candidate division Zixibacteria bacterium]